MAVDGPGADGVFHSPQFPPPGDLFGGPSYGKAVSDVLTEAGRALDLRSAQLSRPDPALCAVWPVAIDISVPAQFPMDRSTMAVQTSSDLCHACQGRKASTHIRHPCSQPDLCIGRNRDHGDKARNRRATASGSWLTLNRSRCSLANSNLDLAIDRTRCWLCSLVRRFLDDLDWKKTSFALHWRDNVLEPGFLQPVEDLIGIESITRANASPARLNTPPSCRSRRRKPSSEQSIAAACRNVRS